MKKYKYEKIYYLIYCIFTITVFFMAFCVMIKGFKGIQNNDLFLITLTYALVILGFILYIVAYVHKITYILGEMIDKKNK